MLLLIELLLLRKVFLILALGLIKILSLGTLVFISILIFEGILGLLFTFSLFLLNPLSILVFINLKLVFINLKLVFITFLISRNPLSIFFSRLIFSFLFLGFIFGSL